MTVDTAELQAQRRARGGRGTPLFDAVDEGEATDRLGTAIANAEANLLTTEAALVERIRAMLRARYEWDADDLCELLDQAGVARGLATRRRLASAVTNAGIGKWWRKVGKRYTRLSHRSGREIAVWQRIDVDPAAR